MKKVMAFGTFDILHSGHMRFLEKAKSLGDKLVVVVARDKTVMDMKKRETIFSESERLDTIKAVGGVDQAVLGGESHDKLKIIEKIRPNVLALGYDQWPKEEELSKELKKRGLCPEIIRLQKFGDISSTKIRDSLKR